MPRVKQNNAANLWPAAGMTLFVFLLLIATGLVITFGVIQQLSYLAWERSLQQTEQSLAAEKELVRLTNDVKGLIDQYQTNPLSVSTEEITELAKQRYTRITQALPENPDSVAEVLTNWSDRTIPDSATDYLETYKVETYRVIESIAQKQDWRLYVIRNKENQTLDLYTKSAKNRNAIETSSLFVIDNVAFEINL